MAYEKGWWGISIENVESAENPVDTAHGELRWVVFIEENQGSGQAVRWDAATPQTFYGTREEARNAALRRAHEHQPRHPWSPQKRVVIRHDEDRYSVVVDGLNSTWHFRVSVGEVVD